ncbi:hypothetical protein HYG81_01760 [Natrinema zhouii]|uniref:Uncharacterized protein n=1 Tax=Natrinema zhouii TaxID=1710539 RepID=A0A7D6CRS7_9EURY|nr:hypothetical protein [Natrinema zhouii]QLK26371.1 hypothetical protein HYG81_01760 [Natrinema zhouii]
MEEETEEEELYLHVSVGDVTVEVKGPLDEAETWFEALKEDHLTNLDSRAVSGHSNGSESNNQDNPTSTRANGGAKQKNRTLTEFYQMTDGITKKDTAFLTGWYLEIQEGRDDFTRKEIEEKAKSAKLTLGANVGRDLNYKVEDGHLAEVGERDGDVTYHVTITGEEYVENELINI